MHRFDVIADKLALQLPSPLVPLDYSRAADQGIQLLIKRDDLIHPDLPGNKWRKLKYNLRAAMDEGASTLLTFGGAYSNHIRAVAAAAHYFGFHSIGVIRGEPHEPLNQVLDIAQQYGMELTYLDRTTYRDKTSERILDQLRDRFGEFFLVPEGGSNATALLGCAELVGEIDVPFDYLCCPCGTGGTLAGAAAGLSAGQHALGFSVLKGGEFLVDAVATLQLAAFGRVTQNWSVEQEFHCGGFAKKTPALSEFIQKFQQDYAVTLDWVYVAKMMYGVFSLIERGRFPAGSTVIAVVTG